MVSQVIAIDYGLKRVGVAVGNTLTKSAEPLETLDHHTEEGLLKELAEIIHAWQPKQLVMGMPYNPEAQVTPHSANLEKNHNQNGETTRKTTNKKADKTLTKNNKKQRKLERKIKNFALRLSEVVGLPVEFIDESFSSNEASRQLKSLRQAGMRSKTVKKEDIDKAAACVILQRWLDNYT